MAIATQKTAAETAYLDAFAAGDDWLAGEREKGFAAFTATGLPHRRMEDWKWTDLRQLIGDEFAFGEHEEDVDTIGGLIFDILSRVPVRGEVIVNNGFEFRIMEADPRRIRRVEVLKSARRRVKRS